MAASREGTPTAPDPLLGWAAVRRWNRRRRATWVSLVSLSVFLVLGAIAPLLTEDPQALWRRFLPFVFISSATLLLLRLGRIKVAVGQAVVVAWLFLTFALFEMGGVRSHVGSGFVALIAIAGTLWHLRAAYVMAGLGLLSLVAAAVAEHMGVLPAAITPPASHALLSVVAGLVITAACVFVGQQLIDAAIANVRHTLERFAALLEQAPDPLIFMNADAVVAFVNPAVERLVGYDATDLMGVRFDRLPIFPAAAAPGLLESFFKLLHSEAPPAPPREVELIHKDGHRLTVEANRQRVRLPDGSLGMQYTLRDTSERRRNEALRLELQSHAQETRRMEAIGRMAGGVAHDFNNLLTVILGQSELLLCQPLDDGMRAQLQQIAKAGDRAKTLTQQLLAVARKQMIAPQRLDPNQAITALDQLLQALTGRSIKLDFHLAPEVDAIRFDPSQFDQLLTHLVARARESMPAGGHLTIRTGMVDEADRARAVLPEAARTGRWLRLTVEDTGRGLAEQDKGRIFEPYSPGSPAQPPSIGLAVVDGIVAQNGGHITITSAPGEGTRFDLYFPAATPAT